MALWNQKKKKQTATHFAYCNVFNLDDEYARVVIKDMCEAHGVFENRFDTDPCMNAFLTGERNVILRILTILGLSPEEIIRLSEEE